MGRRRGGALPAELDATALPRPVELAVGGDARVAADGPCASSLDAAAAGGVKVENGVVDSCLKRRWRFAEARWRCSARLAERRVCALAELCEGAAGRVDERRVRALVGELVKHGLATVVEA